jgi:heme exporter protein B
MEGILLAPIDRTAVFVAKATALLLFLVLVEIVAVPAFGLLLLGPNLFDAFPQLLAVLVLADLGLAVVGALVAGIASETRARDLLVPLLLLPLLVPVVIGAANATEPLLRAVSSSGDLGKWLGLLALYDGVFGLVAFGVFDYLLED